MSEDSVYQDADIVWVKLGTSWWPGEVCGLQRQPKGFCQLTKRKPYCVVKFFQEESFEYVKTSKHILPFNCSKKDEFIRKGHELFKAKKKFMEKFPSDVSTAERLTRSVTRSSLFFNSRPDSIVKAILGESPSQIECALNGRRYDNITRIINITRNSNESPSSNSSPTYKCNLCDFQSNRQNVMVLHRKSHSNSTTTTNKSSVVNVNDSSMTQLNNTETQTKLTAKTYDAEIFKCQGKKIIKPKQVHKLTNSLLPADTEISDVSENKSEQNIATQKKNEVTIAVLEECLSPIKIDPTVQGHNTVENVTENVAIQFIAKKKETCKSEDIQRSFLAEWIDDDEEVLQNLKEKQKETVAQVASEYTMGTKDDELVDQHKVITSNDMQKPFAKIRNIPKKDRRNIVFTDFKNGEDQSQQTIDDIPLQKPLDEIVSSIGKHSPKATAEWSEKKTIEEIKPVQEKVVDSQNTEDSEVRKLTSVNETKKVDLLFVEPITVEELDAQPTQNKTLKMKSHLVDCYSATSQVEKTHFEVPVSEEISTIESSIESSSAKEVTKLFSLNTVKTDSFIVEQLPKSEVEGVQTPATKPPTKNSTIEQVSTAESFANEKCTLNQSAKETTNNELFAESSKFQPIECTSASPSHALITKDLIEERSTTEFSKENTAQELVVHTPLLPEWDKDESTANNQISPNHSGQEIQLLETNEKAFLNETLLTLSISDNSSTSKVDIVEEDRIVERLSASAKASKRFEEDVLEKNQTNLINEELDEVTEPNLIQSTIEFSMPDTSNKTASTSVLPKEPTEFTCPEVPTLSVQQTSAEVFNKTSAIELDLADQSKSTTVNKPSLSCFDFEEEEDTDILTSIAKFKKKYISPEKNNEYGKDSQPTISTSQNREMELKDKQLSAEIESLLKTTALSVEFAGPLSSTERTITNEVRGLPIKERGKRIFKSRNRFKIESSPSVTTTTTLKVQQESCASRSTALSNEEEPYSTKISTDIETRDTVRKNQNNTELPIDAPSTKEEAMDDKVTNSEEEIIGKVVFSPTEVYAPSADFLLNEFAENKEGLVSSSGMDTSKEPPHISEQNQSENNLKTLYVAMKESQVQAADSCIGETHTNETTEIQPSEKQEFHDELQNMVKESIQQDHPNSFFVMEESEPIYEVEIYDADLKSKPSDPNYETSEYDLITTEVKSIVDRIISDDEGVQSEENIEGFPIITHQESSEVVACIDNAKKLTEITSADNIQVAFEKTIDVMVESSDPVSFGDPSSENSSMVLKHKEERDASNPDQTDESNSSATIGIYSKNSYPEKCIHVESFEEESRQTEVDRAEASSDDTSTVISDAEAEFGSPTSMLEDDRVFKSGKSDVESKAEDTNATKIKEHDKILKKDSRRSRVNVQNSINIKSSQSFDTQESALKDIFEHNVSNVGHNEKPHANANIKVMKHKITEKIVERKELQPHESEENYDVDTKGEPLGRQETAKNEDIFDIKQQLSLQENFLGPISESDSCEEDEEEICSPPIEPLLDESRDEENLISDRNTKSKLEMQETEITKFPTENCAETTVSTYNENEEPIMNFKSALSKIQTQELCELSEKDANISIGSEQIFALPNEIQVASNSENNEKNNSASNTFYTIVQKSDTLIKLNKSKEKINNADSDDKLTESDIVCEKLEIAGEELSAAEALLLIPNQSSNVLDGSKDLTKAKCETLELSTIDDIKEEILDNMEPISQSLEHKPLDIVRRKRRSHMKVTPRKRVLDSQNSDKLVETPSAHARSKFLKLSPDPEDSLLKQTHEICGTSAHTKTFAEQYEDSIVLKYIKDQSGDDIDLDETLKSTSIVSDKSSNSIEKPPQEKVHITVDISNPLSSQIASILGTSLTDTVNRVTSNKRKQTLEDDIPSFIIKRPNPKTIAEAEAADRETIAQIQNLCPHVEITRKSSRDDLNAMITPLTQSVKPHIINQQILRSGNQPSISVTARPTNLEEGMFDISSMPIVLSNETICNEKLHIVQVVKKFQPEKTSTSNHGSSSESLIPIAVSKTTPGIPIRRSSSVRTKRTPSRQQLQEQQNQEQQQQTVQNIQVNACEQQENQQQSLQQYHIEPHQLQQQHHNMQTQHHLQHQTQIQPQQHRQVQLRNENEQRFEPHQSNISKEDQQILIQRNQQQLIFQQQPLQIQQQLSSSGKVSPSNSNDKQMGVDSRGNKYVIIKAPSNTVVMGNITEQNKGQRLQQHPELLDNKVSIVQQRNQRQLAGTSKNAVSHQTSLSHHPPHSQSPFSIKSAQQSPQHQLPQVSNQSSHLLQQPPHLQTLQTHNSPVQTCETITTTSNLITSTTKPKGQGRGRKAKQSTNAEAPVMAKEHTSKNPRMNTNGKRSSGSICDIPRQRSTRSANVNNKSMPLGCSNVHQSVGSNFGSPPIYTTTEQQTQSVVYMTCPQSIISPSSPILSCTNNMQHQDQQLNQRRAAPVITGIPIETSDGSGVGYAVPSLPVPGYPQTFLLCELIDKKYREVYPKPLYLSQDRTRFFEVPDELVTEAHRKLTDCRREPNPDVLEVVSAGNQNVLQPRVDISSKTTESPLNDEQKFQSIDFVEANVTNDVLMQNSNESNSIEEEASALLCLQEQISQEQIVQEQFVHEQFAQEHIGHEQLVQEQLVQEQIVREQLAQDQLVQEQLAQRQFVQEQLMQHQIDAEHGILQVATIETEEVQDNIIQHLEPESVVMEESVETTRTMLINLADQQIIVDQNVFFDAVGHENIGILSSDSNTYTLSPEAVQALLNSLYGHRTITSASFGTKVCEQQQIVMNENMLQAESPSADILTVALDDSGLYSEEQFINTGDILQIESADDLQLIGNADENTNIVFQPMTTLMSAKTSETNVLLNQAPKMSTVETPSDNKSKFVAGHSTTATLDDCLNVIGVPVQSPIVPVSLELPTSVTNSAIVAKIKQNTAIPGSIIAAGVCHHPDVTSLPSLNNSESDLHYEFFSPSTGSHSNEVHANEESVVADIGEYTVVSSGSNFDDPGR